MKLITASLVLYQSMNANGFKALRYTTKFLICLSGHTVVSHFILNINALFEFLQKYK